MCGRFSFTLSAVQIKEQLRVEPGVLPEPNYNIAPTQQAAVITNQDSGLLQFFRWGLIPFWAKDTSFGARMINARSEGIESKPAFRNAIRKKRCLVPADSFYEWKKEGKQKLPYRIRLKDSSPMLMAGIWESWQKEGQVIYSFSIITRAANKEIAFLHHRMPVILTEKSLQENWLDEIDLREVKNILDFYQEDFLDIYQVSQKVNSVRNNFS